MVHNNLMYNKEFSMGTLTTDITGFNDAGQKGYMKMEHSFDELREMDVHNITPDNLLDLLGEIEKTLSTAFSIRYDFHIRNEIGFTIDMDNGNPPFIIKKEKLSEDLSGILYVSETAG